MSTLHSVKLIAYNYVDIASLSYNNGDVIYDKDNATLRLMDGYTPGGQPIATRSWVNANSLTVSTLAPAISAQLSVQLANYSTTTQIASTYATQSALTAAIGGLVNYTLPIATATTLGGVKPDGTTITVNPTTGVISGANTYVLPKAIAANQGGGVLGGVIPDGITIVYNPATGIISGSNQYTLPIATNSVIGGVSIPLPATSGLNLNVATGALSLAVATSNQTGTGTLGGVIPDGTSIVINNGVISGYAGYTLPAATSTVLGGVIIPVTANSGLTNSSGTIRLATASSTQLGGVKVDNATIIINSQGVISAQITGAIVFQGQWNAATNTPFLTNGVGTNGFEYVCTVGSGPGGVNFGAGSIVFVVGDNVIYNGTIWVRVPLGSTAGTTTYALTLDNSGTGATSGSTFNGSAAVTLSYNTIGASPLVGSASIATVGTVTAGTWQGTTIGSQYGGTGINNSPYTITVTGTSQTLNQSVASGASPTFTGTNFTGIPNGGLTNSSITFGSTAQALGSTVSAINGVNVGTTTPGTGAFTTLASSGVLTHNTTVYNQTHTGTSVTLAGMASSGSGVFTCTAPSFTLVTNMTIVIAGANTGTALNITPGQYTITTVSSQTNFTISALSAATSGTIVTQTWSASGTIVITSAGLGTINNMSVGATTASTGTFTTLSATGALTANGANVSHSLAPTGTGSVTINPTTAGSINNMSIGGTTAALGTFTGVTVNSAANTPAITTAAVTLSSTAWTTAGINLKVQARTYTDTSSLAGTVAASYINAFSAPTFSSTNAITITDAANLYVAAPVAGSGSTLTQGSAILTNGVIKSTVAIGTAPFVVASTTQVANLNASTLGGATFAAPGAIGGTTAGTILGTTIKATGTSAAVGYNTGASAGGVTTQTASRTSAVTLSKITGQITLVSAAGNTAAWTTFTVTNTTVAATDTVIVNAATGTNTYLAVVSAVAAGSFNISFVSITGTATDSPVFNFAVIKGSNN